MHSFERGLFWLAAGGVSALSLPAEIAVQEDADRIEVQVSGRPVLVYHTVTVEPPVEMDPVYASSGFVHPLFSPSGRVLTDPFPAGHAHQHGVFSAWTRATFRHQSVDFWNQHQRKGRNLHETVDAIAENGFRVTRRQVDAEGKSAIREHWDVAVQDRTDVFVVDVTLYQETATADEVYLHPYHYGGFAFRGPAAWNEEAAASFTGPMRVLTGNGTTDLAAANHERPRWVAAWGAVDGATAGVVIMDHPLNFRHPQPVRIHPEMPYFVFSPVVAGSFVLQPGFLYRARYRLITFDGEPEAETIEDWYRAFAETSSATVRTTP